MQQTISIKDTLIDFKLHEGANCWQTQTKIDNLDIEIEIDFLFHKSTEIDWDYFKDFFVFVSEKGRLKKLIEDSHNLVTEMGKAFFRECLDEVSDFKMHFSNAIYYNGKTSGQFIRDGYSYSLIFTYYVERDGGIYADDYGNYLVDVENHIIVGVRRYQC